MSISKHWFPENWQSINLPLLLGRGAGCGYWKRWEWQCSATERLLGQTSTERGCLGRHLQRVFGKASDHLFLGLSPTMKMVHTKQKQLPWPKSQNKWTLWNQPSGWLTTRERPQNHGPELTYSWCPLWKKSSLRKRALEFVTHHSQNKN